MYSTASAEKTVTIDYNQTFRQFLTDKERVPFSAERILGMLNQRSRACHVTIVGRLHIVVGEAHCVLTQQAVAILASLYQQRRDWQIEYPCVSNIFFNACVSS